jgi:hypothetical protein
MRVILWPTPEGLMPNWFPMLLKSLLRATWAATSSWSGVSFSVSEFIVMTLIYFLTKVVKNF